MLPKSLLLRFILILTVPSILCQAISIYIFYHRHWNHVSSHTAAMIYRNISLLVYEIDEENFEIAKTVCDILDMEYKIGEYPEYADAEKSNELNGLENMVQEIAPGATARRIDNTIVIHYTQHIEDKPQNIYILTRLRPLITFTTDLFIMWLISLNVIWLLVSFSFANNQIRSILALAKAADDFGKGIRGSKDFKPSGAKEVRMAGNAFIKMRDNIEKYVDKHTTMLAMISHDLRTPLTRIKLQMALLPSSQDLEEMKKDVVEMESMINGYLSFTEGKIIDTSTEINLYAFIRDLFKSNSYKIKHEVSAKYPHSALRAKVNLATFKRAISNIISNAVKHATQVHIHIYCLDNFINIEFHDDGPGVDDNNKNKILQPFYKAGNNNSGSSESTGGGMGLGLNIAMEILHEAGGSLCVQDSAKLGGMCVIVKLPTIKPSHHASK